MRNLYKLSKNQEVEPEVDHFSLGYSSLFTFLPTVAKYPPAAVAAVKAAVSVAKFPC